VLNIHPMKNLDGIVQKIDKYIDQKDHVREEALHSSRDIVIHCRKAIHCLHRMAWVDAETFMSKASADLAKVYETTKNFPDLSNAGFVETAAQEYGEARCLSHIIHGKELPDPDELQITYSSYLMGLCDVVGELRRGALDFILKGDATKAHEYLLYMDMIYEAVMNFDYPSALLPIKQKQDMIRGLIEKTRGELAVASCEQRIGEKSHEFRGILDSIHNEKKNNDSEMKKKNEEHDIDVDKVW
jgi:translin